MESTETYLFNQVQVLCGLVCLNPLAQTHDRSHHIRGGVVHPVICPVKHRSRSRLHFLQEKIGIETKFDIKYKL